MFYRKFEIAQSLNGDKIMFIARNPSGIVVVRETSEKRLKHAIDNYIEYLEGLHAKADKAQAKEDREQKIEEKKQEPAPTKEEIVEAKKEEEIEVLLPPPQKDIRRGPGGKFISRSQMELEEQKQKEEDKKKSFWQKLTD